MGYFSTNATGTTKKILEEEEKSVGPVKKTSSGSGSNTSGVVKKTSTKPSASTSSATNGIFGLLGSNRNGLAANTTQKTSNSGTTSNNTTNSYGVGYDANTDYQAIINDAVARGDYQSAALAELARNAKIVGTGSNLPTTSKYSGYLNPDYGTLGQSQMAAGASWEDVLATYNSRYNKAMTTEGLQQYANDAIQQQMWKYIQDKMQSGSQADALAMFNEWLAEYEKNNPQPEYTSQYNAQMDALLNQILNREDFSYDVMNDPLYQQYAQMYQRNGERAMENTLAEAAAGAGGMNSYAVTAASQAYNNYNAQLNDKIPELYQIAYNMYLGDKESMVQDLGLLQNMDATQYARYRDTMNDYYNDKSFAYGSYMDAINQGNLDRDFNYNSAVANRDYLNNNIWNNKEWNENQADKELENTRYDQATAKEEVWNYIKLGVMPSAELIAQAGMTETDVRLAVEAVKADKGKTSSGGNGGSTEYTKDGTKKTGLFDGLKKTVDAIGDVFGSEGVLDTSNYQVTNEYGDDWVMVNGTKMSWSELLDAVEDGDVTESIDHENGTISYVKKAKGGNLRW